jgi:DNA-binding HxlR family transcriptional regulator
MKQGSERFVPITQEQKDLILMYRKEHKLSYRAIEKRLGVSRETARLYCIEAIPQESKDNLKRLKIKKDKVVNNKVVTRIKKPLPQYNSVRDYDFLQYIRVVFKWALQHHKDLNKGKLDILLYLYPKGAFTFSQFHIYYKLIGLYQRKALTDFISKGYVKVWRQAKKGEPKLYSLTNKGKDLCDMMHKYCTGDEVMPLDDTNNLTTDKTKRINNYYVDMIKVMGKRKK